jgi:hypothetical protein
VLLRIFIFCNIDSRIVGENVVVLDTSLGDDIVSADVEQVAVAYNAQNDRLSIGVGCKGVCRAARKRAANEIAVALDLGTPTSTTPDDKLDVVVARDADGKLTLYRIDADGDAPLDDAHRVPATIIERNPSPDVDRPDIELTIVAFDDVRAAALKAEPTSYVSLKRASTFRVGVAPLKIDTQQRSVVAAARPDLSVEFVQAVASTTADATATTTTTTADVSSATTTSIDTTSSGDAATTTATVVEQMSAVDRAAPSMVVAGALALLAIVVA